MFDKIKDVIRVPGLVVVFWIGVFSASLAQTPAKVDFGRDVQPIEKHQFISAAATNWAVMALAPAAR